VLQIGRFELPDDSAVLRGIRKLLPIVLIELQDDWTVLQGDWYELPIV